MPWGAVKCNTEGTKRIVAGETGSTAVRNAGSGEAGAPGAWCWVEQDLRSIAGRSQDPVLSLLCVSALVSLGGLLERWQHEGVGWPVERTSPILCPRWQMEM